MAFFLPYQGELVALGIGAFGPLDPRLDSPTFGCITSTPKPGWAQTDVVGPLRRALDLPVAFDTDVNAAAFGEYLWGVAQDHPENHWHGRHDAVAQLLTLEAVGLVP